MTTGGYFKVYREAYDKVFSQGPDIWAVFSWMLFQVRWRDGRLKAGQVATTLGEIERDCGLPRHKVRKAVDWLEGNGTVSIERKIGRGKGITITMTNWSHYQNALVAKPKKAEPKRGGMRVYDPDDPRPRD